MSKKYTALGLMSGTSGDGVDASIVQSDGKTKYRLILDKFFKYDENIFKNIHSLKSKISKSKDLNILKTIEIQHARLAMIGTFVFIVEGLAGGRGPLDFF